VILSVNWPGVDVPPNTPPSVAAMAQVLREAAERLAANDCTLASSSPEDTAAAHAIRALADRLEALR